MKSLGGPRTCLDLRRSLANFNYSLLEAFSGCHSPRSAPNWSVRSIADSNFPSGGQLVFRKRRRPKLSTSSKNTRERKILLVFRLEVEEENVLLYTCGTKSCYNIQVYDVSNFEVNLVRFITRQREK